MRKPLVPDGPIRAFFDKLHALHLAAGQPSMRELQRRTRSLRRPNGINPTTIHDALAAPRLPRWETVAALVDQLGGSVTEFAELWQQGHAAELRLSPAHAAGHTANLPPFGAAAAPPMPLPQALPPGVHPFVGRRAELVALDRLLAGEAGDRSALTVAAVVGSPGVGKTALALRWAHRVAGQFPDGQLYVDMRGYDPGPQVPPGQALAVFLRALGVPTRDIPRGVDERAAWYRSLLAGRRVLVVLDNVRSAAHVPALLPGTPACFVLVTSRDSLAGLVARHGAHRVELGRFSAAEATELTRALVGTGVDAASGDLAHLAELCARLPLALRIAAELAAARRSAGLTDLVHGADDGYLDLLDAGADPGTGLREVFSWSYRHLPEDAARAFRMLSRHDGPDFDAGAVSALAGIRHADARRLSDVLAHAHLIERARPGRFAVHRLLRAYATELSRRDDRGAVAHVRPTVSDSPDSGRAFTPADIDAHADVATAGGGAVAA
ncbi:MAG TPA: NB-ARC domain-containing protein [Rugosimonospora sp.]|nr:NB-ARC domain-containing protein [Rugosimonospora sp.]